MASNFKIAVTELSNKLSLKSKRKVSGNFTKIEKPLSRNVRFLDLSTNNCGYKEPSIGASRRIGESTLLNTKNSS